MRVMLMEFVPVLQDTFGPVCDLKSFASPLISIQNTVVKILLKQRAELNRTPIKGHTEVKG